MVFPTWITCCAVREDDRDTLIPCVALRRQRVDIAQCHDGIDDELEFFECAETLHELAAIGGSTYGHGHPAHSNKIAEDDISNEHGDVGRNADCCSQLVGHRDCSDLVAARTVLTSVRERWARKMKVMYAEVTEAPELEWATLDAARRMLKANIGDVQKAIDMFEQALEMRARDRKLFSTLQCEARSDLRVIGRDLEGHPVVYFCTRSQEEPLRCMRDQFVVTFEAACKLTSEMGKVSFIADMHGLRPSLNMDIAAIKDLSDTLGTVFAERIHRITVIDFSRAAQTLWWCLKPMLSEKTREKFAFVGAPKAKELFSADFDKSSYECICNTIAMNRNPNTTYEERALHARRTTISDVPFGPPLPA
mmetsp:Transcript_84670/g.218231  ORF Transcript_84670/g.218231 Transcript_84670/m.218231 type:complete len:364 (-) Transcript_84670:146-1237(-)